MRGLAVSVGIGEGVVGSGVCVRVGVVVNVALGSRVNEAVTEGKTAWVAASAQAFSTRKMTRIDQQVFFIGGEAQCLAARGWLVLIKSPPTFPS